MKIKSEIKELNAKFEHLHERFCNLREDVKVSMNDELKSYIRKCVWESMQSWLDSGHKNIVSYINDKEITTKFIRDEIKELNEKKYELEQIVKEVNDTLEKYEGEKWIV